MSCSSMLPPPPCSYSGADMQSAGNSAEPRPNARSYRLVWPPRSCSWLSDGIPRCDALCALLLISVHDALRDRTDSRSSFCGRQRVQFRGGSESAVRALHVQGAARAKRVVRAPSGTGHWALCPREIVRRS